MQEIVIKSPLTDGPVKKIAEFKTNDIIAAYKADYKMDVSSIFRDKRAVYLYQCLDSGYEFYYPFDIAGKDDFYKQLAVFDWYYISWKWEHQQSLRYVAQSLSILEVGCGSGAFLKNIQQRYPDKKLRGLEITLNDAPEKFIVNASIEEYVEEGGKEYDLVCSYQVLEHIANISSFLDASVKALKPGGHLVISVPNNDSVLLENRGESLLNLPPHHMGLWNKRSLDYLTTKFPLQLVKEYYEPIQDYHFEWFKNIIRQKIRKKNFPLTFRLTDNKLFMNFIGRLLKRFYRGHSIMFVFKKL